jgi:hypothetical protein
MSQEHPDAGKVVWAYDQMGAIMSTEQGECWWRKVRLVAVKRRDKKFPWKDEWIIAFSRWREAGAWGIDPKMFNYLEECPKHGKECCPEKIE